MDEGFERESRLRLKNLREKSGKDPYDLREFTGGSVPSYYDMENCDGDLFITISLGELRKLCRALGAKPRDVFQAADERKISISIEDLSARIKSHIKAKGQPVADFETQAGFYIEAALADSSNILTWSIECLRSVCDELGINWLDALPE